MKTLIAVLVIGIIGLYYLGDSLDATLNKQMKLALKSPPDAGVSVFQEGDSMQASEGGFRLSEKEIHHLLGQEGLRRSPGIRYWKQGGGPVVAATALGADGEHHFVNAYLVGYAPFEAAEPWVPLYAMGLRLKYQLDSKRYAGIPDVWQTSQEAFFNALGDCEDHALLLADWLIEMGYDARVVVGRHRNKGHAWVVVFGKSDVYLLEATSKRKLKNWKNYPLARMVTDYYGVAMFNREHLWVHTGRLPTPDYRSPAWKRTSQFFPLRN
jgi:hypothetical protein